MGSYEKSDRDILRIIGDFVRDARLQQNLTQHALAEAADLNRSTLSAFEQGNGANLLTFLRILRVLGKLEILDAVETTNKISPLLIAKMEQQKRRRAGHPEKKAKKPTSDW